MNPKLHPMWVVGFVDGEGCFRASILKSPKLRFQTQIQMEFVVVQHVRDVDLLYKLKTVFQCGIVNKTKGQQDKTDNTARFRVRKLADLCEKVIPFFEQHSLKTKKKVEFLRFRELCYLLNQKVHLTEEGFSRCLNLAKNLPYSVGTKVSEKTYCFIILNEDRVQPLSKKDLNFFKENSKNEKRLLFWIQKNRLEQYWKQRGLSFQYCKSVFLNLHNFTLKALERNSLPNNCWPA